MSVLIDIDRVLAIMRSKRMSKDSLAKAVGVDRKTIYNYLQIGVIKKDELLEPFAKALGVEKEEFTKEEKSQVSKYINRVGEDAVGLDLLDETESTKNQAGNEFWDLSNGMVLMSMPLVPEYAYASYPRGWKDHEYIIDLPKYNIVLPKSEKGRFRAFEVRGESMDDGSRDAICHKDVAIGRFVEPDLWRHKLYTNGGTDYVVVTHDGLIIKRIVKHNVHEGIITCASINPDKDEYPDFDVRLSEVYELYFIRKIDRDWNRR
ncbi:LexA family transcriptional regulator [Spirosoma sp. RP8]|uniref:LexA family transcriptional regulator n=1 Tax=Spirosoma liriopis TaxID=2937440 RepID=A0ABT0HN13_9BACT|nr:LexA family transcriptional regulator [Spirosoma liriopis]MCK8493559.1 LexA family transcriptional regulator [Spirosoma liriopis]